MEFEQLIVILAAAALALAALWIVRALVAGLWTKYDRGRVTIFDYEIGVRYREGVQTDLLGPGRYTTWPEPVHITRVDMRVLVLAVPGQEMLTADKLPLRASVLVSYRVVDARAFARNSASPSNNLYQNVQTALRARIAARTLDDALADRDAITTGLAQELEKEAALLGLSVSAVKLLDLTLVGQSKQAYADLWKAQKEGLAALERARGEQASLRALANAARMLKGNPELMNLRLLQALSAAPGKAAPTIVLGAGAGILPVASASDAASAPEEGA
ncbi:MAG: slipin family protein [Hyphomonadaceae bacterium]